MKKPILLFFLLNSLSCLFFCHGIESPQFTVILAESDFEIRLYRESWWMSAPVEGNSFEMATRDGFHRLYQYIHGVNADSSRIAMTAPILTSMIIPKAQQPLEYIVRFYLSEKFHGTPPLPGPDLNLELGKWPSHCMVVRKFAGFARDDNISKEAASLIARLVQSNSMKILEDVNTYTIAQYNSSSHLVGRLNEVWMLVAVNATEGC